MYIKLVAKFLDTKPIRPNGFQVIGTKMSRKVIYKLFQNVEQERISN